MPHLRLSPSPSPGIWAISGKPRETDGDKRSILPKQNVSVPKVLSSGRLWVYFGFSPGHSASQPEKELCPRRDSLCWPWGTGTSGGKGELGESREHMCLLLLNLRMGIKKQIRAAGWKLGRDELI